MWSAVCCAWSLVRLPCTRALTLLRRWTGAHSVWKNWYRGRGIWLCLERWGLGFSGMEGGLGAETFLAEGTAWEKVGRREDAGVLAKGKNLIQGKRRGYFFHPDAGLIPRSLGSSAIVKDRFHGSQPDFLFPSVQFFPCLEISLSISDALLHVLLCVILRKTPNISSTPSYSVTWYFS